MEVNFTFFDYLPDELIVIVLQLLRDQELFHKFNNRIESLYNKFIENVKSGNINPDDAFNYDTSQKSIDSIMSLIKYIGNSPVTRFLIGDGTYTSVNKSNSELLEIIKYYMNNIIAIYLLNKNVTFLYTSYYYIGKSKKGEYISFTYNKGVKFGTIIIKYSNNWHKFYNKILTRDDRNLLLLRNNYLENQAKLT